MTAGLEAMMNRQFEQITAIYTRVDSGKYDMETAISQQKAALSEYAQGHGLTNIQIGRAHV